MKSPAGDAGALWVCKGAGRHSRRDCGSLRLAAAGKQPTLPCASPRPPFAPAVIMLAVQTARANGAANTFGPRWWAHRRQFSSQLGRFASSLAVSLKGPGCVETAWDFGAGDSALGESAL